ncbi:MAG: hypothetical protein CMO46_01525 [Verrucomicrobiales bacterium]|nr:hypothetical protein [Verrucomicrobiales bacterium]
MVSNKTDSADKRVDFIRKSFPDSGLFLDKTWRQSPYPVVISKKVSKQLHDLGRLLANYLTACNSIYLQSHSGKAPEWVANYLDSGKPQNIINQGRSKSIKNALPRIIRPDLILTDEGFAITEIDSVPGGIGLTGWLNKTYSALGDNVLGGPMGMMDGFKNILPKGADIVISEEAKDYKPEMEWFIEQLNEGDNNNYYEVLEAESYEIKNRDIYRFYELFDLENIPPAEDIFKHAKDCKIEVSSPHKAFLEEKMWSALFHSQPLRSNWLKWMRQSQIEKLQSYLPYSWVIDPSPVPHYAELPRLGINNWNELSKFSQKQRELVLKISGFSELAWGSRSVKIGHDLSAEDWKNAVEMAIEDFPSRPWVMQKFKKAKVFKHSYWDISEEKIKTIDVRARLCPYYFTSTKDDSISDVKLGGILATLVPSDKKIIHGMSEAIMAPCIEE